MGNIFVHDFCIPAQPVKIGAGMLHLLIITAKDHTLQLLIGIFLAGLITDGFHHLDQHGQRAAGLPAGTADDGCGNPAVGILGKNGACHERTHGMTKQNIRQVRKFRHGILHQLAGILDGRKPAAMEIALLAATRNGLAVAHMILSHHHKSQPGKIIGKGIVALHKFRYAVNDLQNSLGITLRHPAAVMDLSCAMGVKIMIGSHTQPSKIS